MDTLKVAVENKKEQLAREGALFAFEALSERLGRLFEPYVISILPMLLVCFGDSVPAVREVGCSLQAEEQKWGGGGLFFSLTI